MRTFLRRTALALAALPVVLIAIVLLLLSLGITVRLDPLRPSFENAASSALGREVALEGSMLLVPSFSPTVEVQGLRVANPPDWPTPDFARMEARKNGVLKGVLILDGKRAWTHWPDGRPRYGWEHEGERARIWEETKDTSYMSAPIGRASHSIGHLSGKRVTSLRLDRGG